MGAARRNFWLAWVTATVVGGLLAFAFETWVSFPAYRWFDGTVPASNLRDVGQVADRMVGRMIGVALVAAAQAFVLRRVLGRVLGRGVTWVTAAAVGALLAFFLTYWLGGQLFPHRLPLPPDSTLRWFGLVSSCAGALVLATCLWLAVLRDADRNGLFIVASVAAAALLNWYVGPAFEIRGGMSPSDLATIEVEHVVATGLVMGALTGLILALSLIRPKPAPRRHSSRPAKRGAKRRPARVASR
jgi:hypothetical protein